MVLEYLEIHFESLNTWQNWFSIIRFAHSLINKFIVVLLFHIFPNHCDPRISCYFISQFWSHLISEICWWHFIIFTYYFINSTHTEQNEIHFLDKTIKYHNFNFYTNSFRKPAWSGTYLNFLFLSPMFCKKSAVNRLDSHLTIRTAVPSRKFIFNKSHIIKTLLSS